MRFSAFVVQRLFAVLFLKRFPPGVLAACSASRAARFGSNAGKKPLRVARRGPGHKRRDRRSEDCVLERSRTPPAGVVGASGKKERAKRRVSAVFFSGSSS